MAASRAECAHSEAMNLITVVDAFSSGWQPVCRSHLAVPLSRVFHRALLVAIVDVCESISLAVAIGPIEIVEQTPCVKCAHFGAVANCARKLGQYLPKESRPALIGNAASFFCIRRVDITAAAFCDFDWRVIVFVRDLRDEIVDATWPDLELCVRERPFSRHHRMKARVGIA